MNKLIQFKKNLRTNQTNAESRLWYYLRNRNLKQFKFRRQHVLGGYIVDFVCLEKRLIIELDGSQHMDEQKNYDERRTSSLRNQGFNVLRFLNNEIFENLHGVLGIIYSSLGEHEVNPSPAASQRPLPQGER